MARLLCSWIVRVNIVNTVISSKAILIKIPTPFSHINSTNNFKIHLGVRKTMESKKQFQTINSLLEIAPNPVSSYTTEPIVIDAAWHKIRHMGERNKIRSLEFRQR